MNVLNVETVTLNIETLAATQVVSREWLKHLELRRTAETADDWIANTLALQMVRKIATVGGDSVTIPEIRVPDGLWQSCKERWAGPFLRWFPVRYRVLQREQTWRAFEMLPNVDLPNDYRIGALKVLVPR